MKCLLIALAFVALVSASTVGVAHLKGTTNDPTIDGTVYFVQLSTSSVWVWANVSGITFNFNSLHGMHIHTFGDLFDQRLGTSLSSHYVGSGASSHSCEPNATRHEGDMGNWQVTNGAFTLNKTLDLLSLTSATSIIGKGIVLHNLTDDCGVSADPTGKSGARLAIGVVGIANPAYYPADVLAAVNSISDPVSPNGAISTDTNPLRAVAIVMPTVANTTSFPSVTGMFVFEQDGSGAVTVTAQISGLTSGQAYGIHIHSFADFYTNGVATGTAAGGHYNATGNIHGGPGNVTRHNGDLGNICIFDQAGFAYYQWTMNDGKFTLNGDNNVLGRNIIIHSIYDAMTPSAALGQRISQGVIGVANNTLTAAARITLPTGAVFDPLCAAIPTPIPATPVPSAAPGTIAPTTVPGAATIAPTAAPGTIAPTTVPGSATPAPTPKSTSTTGARVSTSTTSSASSVILSAFVFVAAFVAALF